MGVPPKIDTRNFETILQEIRQLVPFYTPEWQVSEHQDSGYALLQIFARMMADTLQQLNQVPEKNFLAFLDTLGIKLLPPRQARAPVIFYLNQGTTQSVWIPAKTEVATAASTAGGDVVVFETEKSILATPAKMVAAYSVNSREDGIFVAPPSFLTGERLITLSARLVFEVKPNDTSLFLNNTSGIRAGDVLKIASSTELLDFEYVEVDKVSDNKVTLKDKVNFAHNIDTSVEKVLVFELFEGKNQQEHILYLG
jgi:hypothetical protein